MLSEDRTNGARADLSPRWPQCSRAVPRRRAAATQTTSRAAGQDDPQRLNNPRMMRGAHHWHASPLSDNSFHRPAWPHRRLSRQRPGADTASRARAASTTTAVR